jgi:hypothetical protein
MAVAVALLSIVPAALAGNAGNARLDEAAATISRDGTLKAYCESDQAEWDQWMALGLVPADALGFTSLLDPDPVTGGHFIYIGPRHCADLSAFTTLIPPKKITFPYEELGAAILVLTHEAMHQRLDSSDEALVECNALKYLPWVLQTVFHIPETVIVKKRLRVRVKRHGRWQYRWRSVRRRVRNADYAAAKKGAVLLDASAPPEYHGATC